MNDSARNSAASSNSFGANVGRIGSACVQILNLLADHAHRSAERSRFAQLPRRYLDDVGMTIAERDAQIR
jgi:hypothetical protein